MERIKQMIRAGGIVVVAILSLCCVRQQPTPPVVSETLIEDSCSWDGTLMPSYCQGQPVVTIKKFTIAPKSRLVWHRHSMINAGVLTRGTLKVEDDRGRTVTLHAGDPIIELVGRDHYGENPGDEPAEIIVFYAGDGSLPMAIPRD